MVGNIGGNFVRFMRKSLFFVNGIKYYILTVYIVSRPCAKLPFLPWKQSLTTSFSFWVKDDDCLRTLLSRENYQKVPSLNFHN